MNTQKILIADDNERLVRLIARYLDNRSDFQLFSAYTGKQALSIIEEENPDLIILDILMPEMNGYALCEKLKKQADTSLIPVIIISSRADISDKITGIKLGASDYLPKPFDFRELEARIKNILKRENRILTLNSLTCLPGSTVIEEETKKTIGSDEKFAFCYADINNFKPFNDVYGYKKGDIVIKNTADIIKKAVYEFGDKQDFVGHIGGDDFVFITHPKNLDDMCDYIINKFDNMAAEQYSDKDGYIHSLDRQENYHQFPLMTISIGAVTNEKRKLNHYAKVVEIATEMKRYIKNLTQRKNSFYMKDRRKEK
ncbi:MAG: response regulator [Atribacterota bacterium]